MRSGKVVFVSRPISSYSYVVASCFDEQGLYVVDPEIGMNVWFWL